MATESLPGAGRVRLDAAHPWPGLAAYDESSAEFFHGRSVEAAELLRLVQLAPLTVLYGKSGLGKSSLLQAGLFPLLREKRYLPVYLRVDFSDPSRNPPMVQVARRLTEEVESAGAECPAPERDEPLWEYLHHSDLEIWSHDNFLLTPVLVFDQFEELFSRGDTACVRQNLDDLTDLVENRIPAELADDTAKPRRSRLDLLAQRYRVVLSFREDFLAEVKSWEAKVPSLLRNFLRLEAMTRERAIEVVTEAGKAVVADGVAPLIVDFVGGYAGSPATNGSAKATIEPVLLSLFCYQLNLRRGAAQIDGALVSASGQDILDSFYREALADDEVQGPPDVSAFVEAYLVQGERFRGSYPRVEALAEGLLTERQLTALTTRQRLLRVVQYADTARIELIHDCLVPVVCKARDERRVKQRQVELEQKVREKEANNRRLIRWQWGLIAALFGSLASLAYALHQRNEAEDAARRAVAFAAVGASYQMLGGKRELSTLLALQAIASARRGNDDKALERGENALRRGLNHRMQYAIEHEGKVRAVAFSPDGHDLATASAKRVTIWDAQTGAKREQIRPIELRGEVRAMLFSADGTRLVTGDQKGDIRVWDPHTGASIPPDTLQQGAPLSAAAVTVTGTLATGGHRGSNVILWDLATGKCIETLPVGDEPRRWVSDLSFDRTGTALAVSDVNAGKTRVWRLSQAPAARTWLPAFSLRNRKPGVADTAQQEFRMLVDSVTFSPDGKRLATGDRYNAVNLWDAATGAHLDTLLAHTDQVRKVAFSPDGTQLASASDDGTAIVWDVATGRLLFTVTGHSLPVDGLAFSPDGKQLATASRDKQVRVWNVATHGDAVFAVAFSPDGTRLATGSGDNTIKLWDTHASRLIATLTGHRDRVQGLAFSPDGRSLASASYDQTLRTWDLETGQEVLQRTYPDPEFGPDKFYDVVYSPDGRWIATASANHAAVLWDARTGAVVFAGRHGGQVAAVAVSPDGKQLASVGEDGRLKFWSVPSGEPLPSIESPKKRRLVDVAFSPAGDRVVMATGTQQVLLVSTATRELRVLPITRGDPLVLKARFTADGKRLVLIGPESEVVIRDAETGEAIKNIGVHRGKVNDVALSPDGDWIATASQDGSFHVSPLDTDALIAMGCSRVTRKTLSAQECRKFLGVPTCPQPPPCSPSNERAN